MIGRLPALRDEADGLETLVMYDVECDRVRSKVADACLDYGLQRLQYSVFIGELNNNRAEELMRRLKRIVGKQQAVIHLFPVCDKDLKLSREWVQRPESSAETRGSAASEDRGGSSSGRRWRTNGAGRSP